jgi:hypothetical protein
MIEEHSDRRALGAVRFVDAVTGLRVGERLAVAADGVRWTRNLGGLFVVMRAPGIDAATATLRRPPDGPAPGSAPINFTVRDPAGRYLARRCTLPFPRAAAPAEGEPALAEAEEVALFRSSTAPVAPGWAVIRGTVAGETEEERLGGALIRVVYGDGERVLARGLADERGEALVAVPGIPVTTWNDDEEQVLATSVAVTLQVVWDPDAGPLPDPDDLERRRAALLVRTHALTLSSGQVLARTL